MSIVDQETECGSRKDQRKHFHIASSFDHCKHRNYKQDDHTDAAAQSIQTVDQIDSIRNSRDPQKVTITEITPIGMVMPKGSRITSSVTPEAIKTTAATI